MATSIKLKDGYFMDSTGIVHKNELLSNLLNTIQDNISDIVYSESGCIKYADGTMICYGNKNETGSIENYWSYKKVSSAITFAKPFASVPSVAVSCGAMAYLSINTYNKSKNGFSFDVIKLADYGDYNLDYIAVGKWK